VYEETGCELILIWERGFEDIEWDLPMLVVWLLRIFF
jgi:hypothetical protein